MRNFVLCSFSTKFPYLYTFPRLVFFSPCRGLLGLFNWQEPFLVLILQTQVTKTKLSPPTQKLDETLKPDLMHQQLSQSGLRSHIIIRSEKYQQYNCRICFSHHKSLWNTIVEQGAPATHNLWQNVNFWLVFSVAGAKIIFKIQYRIFCLLERQKIHR